MNCKPCGKNFTGMVPYTQHAESEKHKRKVSSLKILGVPNEVECAVCHISFDSAQSCYKHSCKKQNNNSNLGIVSSSVENDATSTDCSNKDQSLSNDESGQYTECKTCNKKFSGSVPYAMHIGSASHKRKVEVEKLNLGTKTIAEDSNTYSCDLCKKDFTGPEPYKQHLASVTHKKKTEETNSGAETTETFSCEPCKKVFTGPGPYNQHLASATHKKKTEVGSNSGAKTVETFFCEPCKKAIKGKVCYEQHLGGAVHKKKLRLIKSIGQIKESDGNVSDSESESPLGRNDVNKPWFCKFCCIQCSGQIPYKQHLTGDLHFRNARIVPKQNKSPQSKAKSVSTDLLNAPKEENADAEVEFSPVNEGNEDKKLDADVSEKEKEDSSKENGSQDAVKEVLIQVKLKKESYAECELCNVQLLTIDDSLSHFESPEHLAKKKSSVKRLHSAKEEEKSHKKLRSN